MLNVERNDGTTRVPGVVHVAEAVVAMERMTPNDREKLAWFDLEIQSFFVPHILEGRMRTKL